MMTRTSNKKSKLFLMSWLGASLFCGVIFAQNLQWINDTSETLFEANFASSGDLAHDVNKIYAKNLGNVITVYMNPKLITQQYNNNYKFTEINNTTSSSPILWWKNIDVNSENVTIIGWTNINVNEQNNNASILWGKENTLQKWENTDATPAILIWWNKNTIWEKQEWNAIIWWENNTINKNIQHAQILWWESNVISTNDVIVAGRKINNTTAWKSFVFSSNEGSENFIPNSSNSFYLNTENWFWINKSTQWKWVETQWAINVWNIDITTTDCTNENIWLFWYFEQCLVWCTTWSANNEGKRNLMDAHTGCVEMCNTNSWHCITPDPIIIPTTGSQCIGSIPNSENYKRCDENDKDNITLNTLDVQFSSQFVDVCPKPLGISANPCLYTCKSDATRIDWEWCQKNCTWVNGVTLKHWETITAYRHTSETCTNQCKDNQALLKCNNGNLINQKNWTITTEYTYTSCTTTWSAWTCDSSFNLTKEQKDQHLTGHNYLTCTGYNVDGPNCAPYNKYKLNPDTPCQNWWTYQSDLWYCTKNCTRNGSSYTRWQTVIGWNAAEVTCTSTSSTCTSKQLTCQEDGSWGADETTYPYTQCNLIWETCEQHKLDSCPAHWYCSECFSYTANSPSQCLSWSIHYRLDRCDDGFTLVNNKCEPECELPRWEKIKYGETRIAFSKTDAECAETCNQNSEKFTCKEGGNLIWQNWWTTGTYRYKECIVHDVICEPNFDLTWTFSHWKFDTCIWYTTDGTSCTEFRAYDLTGCNDYYTYTWDTCKAKCRLPWDNTSQTSTLVDHGTKTWAYLALDETCGDKCTSVYTWIICNEWKRYYQANPTTKANIWAGWYRFKSCEQKVPNCTIYTKSNSNTYITFSGLSQPNIPHATGAMAPCLNYTYQVWTDICQYNFTNYTFKCDLSTDSNSDYARNPAGTACTRCEKPATWNSHTVRNNWTPQPDNVMVGIYNPNSTAACTYQCDEHSKRDWEKCAADCWLTNSSGKDQRYKDWETVIWYTAPSYRCSSASVKCESAQLKCKNWSWTFTSNWQYTTAYKYNYSETISQTVTKTNSDPRRTLDHLDTNRWTVVDLWTEYFTDNSCACTTWNHRYKQTCKSGYSWWKDSNWNWHCYKDCTINWSDASSETIKHWESRTAYQTPSVDCPNDCSSQTRKCTDWTVSGTYTYKNGCTRNAISCSGYSLTFSQLNETTTTYEPCTWYTVSNNLCSSFTKYKISWCKSGYELYNWSCVKICTPDGSKPCGKEDTASGNTWDVKYKCWSTTCYCSDLWDNYYWNGKACIFHDYNDACLPTHYWCNERDDRELKSGSTGATSTEYYWTCTWWVQEEKCTEPKEQPPKGDCNCDCTASGLGQEIWSDRGLCSKFLGKCKAESFMCVNNKNSLNVYECTCAVCKWQYPENAKSISSTPPTSSQDWHEWNGTDACTFKCPPNTIYNSSKNLCVAKPTKDICVFLEYWNTVGYGDYNSSSSYSVYFATDTTVPEPITITLPRTEYYSSSHHGSSISNGSSTLTIPANSSKSNSESFTEHDSEPYCWGLENCTRDAISYSLWTPYISQWTTIETNDTTYNIKVCGIPTPTYTCQWTKPTSYGSISSASPTNSSTYWKCANNTTSACTYTCPSGKTCSNGSCTTPTYTCQWTKPTSYTTISTASPTNSDTYWVCGNSATSACTYTCPSGKTCSNGSCRCTNYMEQQNCEVWQWWSIKWSRDDSTCSCDCPSGTEVTQDNHCESPDCTEREEFYYGNASCPWEKESSSMDTECDNQALYRLSGNWWSCSYNNYCPGHAPMCECYRPCPTPPPTPTYTCQWPEPTSYGSISSASPTDSSTYWKCANNTTLACTYTCPSGKTCSNWTCSSSWGGWGGGWGGCFLPWTPIVTQNWYKNIEDIEAWDIVWSYNEDTHNYEYNTVERLIIHEDNNEEVYDLTVDGQTISATEIHRFYISRSRSSTQCSTLRWVSIKFLKPWDMIVRKDGSLATIEAVTHHPHYWTVYNLSVENANTYFVYDGYLVHNASFATESKQEIRDDGIDRCSGDLDCSCFACNTCLGWPSCWAGW